MEVFVGGVSHHLYEATSNLFLEKQLMFVETNFLDTLKFICQRLKLIVQCKSPLVASRFLLSTLEHTSYSSRSISKHKTSLSQLPHF